MANYLDDDTALKIAKRLKLIVGVSWDDEALDEAANALKKWCHGAIVDNRVYPAEAQARAIVEEAQYWKRWQGIGALYAIFCAKFVPQTPPSNAYKPPSGKRMIECPACDDTGYAGPERERHYCDCQLGENLKADLGEAWLESINSTRPRGAKKTSDLERELGLPAIDVFERSFQEFQERAKTEVADAKKVLEDETATRERKEIARAVLERYQPELKKKKRTRKGATP